jgi:hypothetical protein
MMFLDNSKIPSVHIHIYYCDSLFLVCFHIHDMIPNCFLMMMYPIDVILESHSKSDPQTCGPTESGRTWYRPDYVLKKELFPHRFIENETLAWNENTHNVGRIS